MMKNRKWLLFSLVFAMASCVSLTVNVYFPTAEIEEAAEKIEEQVRSGEGAEDLQSLLDSMTPTRQRYAVTFSFGGREAYAADQKLDIKIQTPIIKKIIASRTKRYKKMLPDLDKGILGEGMGGFLVVRDKTGLNLKALTALKKMVKEENNDRTSLYQEILKANKLESNKENIDRVGKLFSKAIIKTMKAGHWYQVDKKKWDQKKKVKK